MTTYPMTPEAERALETLRAAAQACADHGCYVFVAARMEIDPSMKDHSNTRWLTTVLAPDGGQDKAMLDHAFGDAIRDLSVEWTNMRHESRLQWCEVPSPLDPGGESVPT